MKNTRHNSTASFDEKNSFFLRFFKLRYSAKYDAMIWVFDPVTAFIPAEKLMLYRTKLVKVFTIF